MKILQKKSLSARDSTKIGKINDVLGENII